MRGTRSPTTTSRSSSPPTPGAGNRPRARLVDSPSSEPLDELSFMYFVRTLPMVPGATYRFDRHFDAARNPITVNVIRREVIPTPVGEVHVFSLEMRVRDPRHYEGEGVIRIHLSDD